MKIINVNVNEGNHIKIFLKFKFSFRISGFSLSISSPLIIGIKINNNRNIVYATIKEILTKDTPK
jgi:hypothetical protein